MIQMRRLTTALLLGLLLALGLATATAAPAAAIPIETGCPSGDQVLVVEDLLAQGYRVPAIVDDPANGGNGNGLVCGHAFSEAARQQLCGPDCPVPIYYLFRDDNLKAQK
jgi:hypothetical protein